MNIRIRKENDADFDIITMINDMAFGQENESILIKKLRKNLNYIPELSLVALTLGEIVGHILFFPVKIENDKKTERVLALAPMCVMPEFQNMEIGKKLVTEGLRLSKEMGYKAVIVLGHHEYYSKFGFIPASKFGIRPPFDCPDEAFMVKELVENYLSDINGTVIYPEEFDDVSK